MLMHKAAFVLMVFCEKFPIKKDNAKSCRMSNQSSLMVVIGIILNHYQIIGHKVRRLLVLVIMG